MKACVMIPPYIKPYAPSYTAGLLMDILEKAEIDVRLIDANNLFFNYIYRNVLEIESSEESHIISSNKLECCIKSFLPNDFFKALTKEAFDNTYNEILIRNTFLNKHINSIHFGFFDLRLKHNDINAILCFNKSSDYIINMFSKIIPIIDEDLIFISVMSKEQLYFSALLSAMLKKEIKDIVLL